MRFRPLGAPKTAAPLPAPKVVVQEPDSGIVRNKAIHLTPKLRPQGTPSTGEAARIAATLEVREVDEKRAKAYVERLKERGELPELEPA